MDNILKETWKQLCKRKAGSRSDNQQQTECA